MTYDKMRQDYERMREAEKNRIVDEWKAANGYDDLLAAYAKSARDLEEARAFLRRTAMTGGSIVSSAAMTATQIAIARAADRMLVTPDGEVSYALALRVLRAIQPAKSAPQADRLASAALAVDA